jgi:hypothetical protein
METLNDAYAMAFADTVRAVSTGQLRQTTDSSAKIPWARLRMLVHLYAPQLVDHLRAIESAGPKLGRALGLAIMEHGSDPRQNSRLLDDAMRESDGLNRAIGDMRDAIVRESLDLEARSAKAIGETRGSPLVRSEQSGR